MKGSEILGRSILEDKNYKVITYDFKRPNKFTMEQIRTLSILHETFARLATTSLSAYFRSLIELHVNYVDQTTFKEYNSSLPNPTFLSVIKMEPLHGNAVLQVEPELTFSILDKLFGGRGTDKGIRRDISEIEQTVLQSVIVKISGCLGESWKELLDLRPELAQIEVNPLFTQIVPPSEMTVIIGFDIKFGDIQGEINLCIPYLTIEPLIGKLSAGYWYAGLGRHTGTPPNRLTGELDTDAELYIEGERLSLFELGKLKKGSLVRLEDWDTGKAKLRAGGVTVLSLKVDDRTEGSDFTVVKPHWTESEEERIRMPSASVKSTADETAGLIKKSIEAAAADVKMGIADLEATITEIYSRQDEILDQIYFSSTEREIPEESPGRRSSDLFSYITAGDINYLALLLTKEHPQLTAMVLSFLDETFSSSLLSGFNEDVQVDIIERISSIGSVMPEIAETVEEIIKNRITKYRGITESERGGVETAAEILNRSSRAVEKNVIERLEKTNPELADNLKKNMFVFEDLSLLGGDSIRKILLRVDKKDLTAAMKTVEENVRSSIAAHFTAEERKQFEIDFNQLGRMKLSDIDTAQQRIIAVIRKMEEDGELFIARPEDF